MLMQPDDKQNEGGWTFHKEDEAQQPPPPQEQEPEQQPVDAPAPRQPQPEVAWTASEFISHNKGAGWYATLIGGLAAMCVLVYIFTRDIISIVTIAVVFILFLIIGASKPQQRHYSVDGQGITIGEKFYPYAMFKSFAVLHEGAIGSVNFIPLKRFMPELSVYFAPEDEDRILDVLLSSLPNEQRGERATDRLMKRLRF
jgi:hypothetical protein